MEILNHWLTGKGVVCLPCPKNKERIEGPDMIVLHYTAGASVAGAAFYLARPDVKASAHVVIGRRGEVIQLVAFDTQAEGVSHPERGGTFGRDVEETGSGTRIAVLRDSVFNSFIFNHLI